MIRYVYRVCVAAVVAAAASGAAMGSERTVLAEWKFGQAAGWQDWSPNGAIRDAAFESDAVCFRTLGNDPQLLGPLFEVPRAANGQWVEIDMDCDAAGTGELFYTNKTTGRYGGLEPEWMTRVDVPVAGTQIVTVWPFWASLGKIIRLRFDPPGGVTCRLRAIRIVESAGSPGRPDWSFDAPGDSWHSMCAARLERAEGHLKAHALAPQAVIVTPVEPFDAAGRSLLQLDAECPGEHLVGLHWVTAEQPGLYGVPIHLASGRISSRNPIDLRRFPGWTGQITHLALSFGTSGGETLAIDTMSILDNAPDKPFLRLKYMGFVNAINRPSRPAPVRIILEHAGGPPLAACQASLVTDTKADCGEPVFDVPAVAPGGRFEIVRTITPRGPGRTALGLAVNEQNYSRSLRIDPPAGTIERGDYDVPPPRPVETKYEIGIYYFPGWSPDQFSRWQKQDGFPERDPVLGWYEEGRPEVADWHIKWAVENAISFFVFDWYWRDGKEDLTAGLNDGFLKARYCDQMKFAIMWANHKPFGTHTPEQLLTVTDYWIERYFRRANYLKIDGVPYVSFFSPGELIECLGSDDRTREALAAMRERARAAGLPGLHIAACGGSNAGQQEHFKQAGFDSLTAYNYAQTGCHTVQSSYRHYVLGHEPIWQAMHREGVLPYTPLLTVCWDSRPWHGPRAEARFARRTEDFAEALKRLRAHLDATGSRMAILEAWNEWGEGSYIEPNVEFGFEDIEAVRATFAEPGHWPINIAPVDVGLDGAYDLRRDAAAFRAARQFGASVPLAGVHPAVQSGLEIRCWEDRLGVTPGQARDGRRAWTCQGCGVRVPPADLVEVAGLHMTLQPGNVQSWRGGNRLVISPEDARNLLPDSYVAGSLRLSEEGGGRVVPPSALRVDNHWGAFSLPESGPLQPGQRVVADYRMSLRRIDALVLDETGEIRLVTGAASPDCPVPPALSGNTLHVANIYRPFNATKVAPHHVYVLTAQAPDLSPIAHPALHPVLDKLRAGRPVTVVCWGDSVTAGGDASSPATSYVGLFEAMLKERFPASSIKVINAGVGGSNTKQRLPDFQNQVLDHHPDLVTLEYVNDMGFPVDELQARYEEILRVTRQAGAALLLITPHFTRPDWMNLPRGRGPDARPAVAFLRRFALENDVPLADAARRWEQLEHIGIPYETLLKNGINHPDDRGHRIFAEELMRLLPSGPA